MNYSDSLVVFSFYFGGWLVKRFYVIIVFLLIGVFNPAFSADEQQISELNKNTVIYPAAYDFNDFQWSVGLMGTTLPKDWVETAIKAPLFTFNFKYGLPRNFSLSAAFEFLLVANQIRLGPQWGMEFDNFSFNVGFDLGYVFGALNQFGFKNKFKAFYNYPNISLGYRLNELFFTLQAELMFISGRQLTTDGIETGSSVNKLPGGTISIYLEQPLWKDRIFIIGLKNNITKFYYMAWPAFTTFNKLYWIPQLHLGLVL
jgi:hypothetical protein